jgi:hypothetical protein
MRQEFLENKYDVIPPTPPLIPVLGTEPVVAR